MIEWKRTSGHCFSLGSVIMSWFGKKKKLVAVSSTKVEYMASNHASCEALWLHKLLVG